MSDLLGVGAATIRHGEVRYHASLVRLFQATQEETVNKNPTTVVTRAEADNADNNLGRIVDMKT